MRLRIFSLLLILGIMFQLIAVSAPELIWSHQFSARQGNSVIQTEDGDFICVGHKDGNQFGGNVYLLKVDASGETVWENYWEDSNITNSATEIAQNNSTLFVTGYEEDLPFLTRIDQSGNSIWHHVYEHENIGPSTTFAFDEDDNIVIAGGNFLCFALKTDNIGNELWYENLIENQYPEFCSVIDNLILPNGDYAVLGKASYYQHPDHYWCESFIVTIEPDGSSETYLRVIDSSAVAFDILPNNHFIVVTEEAVYRIDYEENIIWSIDLNFEATSLVKDGENFVIAGYEYSNAYLLKLDADGNEIWYSNYPTDSEDIVQDIALTADNGYILTGSSDSALSLIRLSPEIVSSETETVPTPKAQLTNYPNPFNPSTTISFNSELSQPNEQFKIEVYNLKGQRIREFKMKDVKLQTGANGNKMNKIVWDGTDQNNQPVASGIYYYTLKLDGEVEAKSKMILIK